MDGDVLAVAARWIFMVIFLVACFNLIRRRDRLRLEVASLFGVFAFAIVIGEVGDAFNAAFPQVDLIAALLILTQPYLFLRLVDQFRAVPPSLRTASLVGLIVSWVLVLVDGVPLSPVVTLAVAVLFVAVEGVAVFALILEIRITRGVTRLRMAAIIIAATLLALAILIAGITAGWSAADRFLQPVTNLSILASAIGFYLGFVPPRWLRWQLQQRAAWQFVQLVASVPTELRLNVALDHIGPAATRALGGTIGIVALDEDRNGRLIYHTDRDNRARFEAAHLPTLEVASNTSRLMTAWHERRAIACDVDTAWDDDLASLIGAFGGARHCLIAPLIANNDLRGLIIVLLDRRPMFIDDDLAMLTLLADQAIVSIESSMLFQDAQREIAARKMLLDLSEAIADEPDVRMIADRVAIDIERMIPGSSGVLLPMPNGDLEVVATAGTAADVRLGTCIPAGVGVTNRVYRTGTTVVIDDVRSDPDYLALRAEIGSELATPLRYRDTTIGVLNIERPAIAAFSSADVALVQLVAAHAAQAIARAQLLEQLRQQNLELEAANRHKGEFLANMSHELRTPLNAIIGFSELLLDDADATYDRDTRMQFISTIHTAGEHLLALINDILDLAKVESGHMTLHTEPVIISDLVLQAISTLRPLADRKDIRVVSVVEEVEAVDADLGKVKQILYNLLSNAIKFTPDGGTVTITARRIPNEVHLTVADTGIGIAPDDQARIFDEFQQIDQGPNRRYEGTGLGLALTRRFVELHDGRIWVESIPGEGSQFHVVLPSYPATNETDDIELPSVSMKSPSIPGDAGPLVLIVEDDPVAANLLTLYLGRGGYRSFLATDGHAALDAARERQPVAIILDILLPTLDGWEVLSKLKFDPATRDIPVIIASIVDDRELGFALGADDYFIKPVDRQALLNRLDRYSFTTKVQEREVSILIADDDPDSVQLLSSMLQPAGFHILRAYGGQEAITVATDQLPDLILLDLMMPDISGFDVVDALRANPRTQSVPILIVTAKDLTPEDKLRLNGRVSAILQKGIFGAVDLVPWLNTTLIRTTASGGT